jgi:tRNA-2-methylthio-N6-dimethylallyladenosine synthase
VEGFSKKSDQMLFGRNSQNAVIVFDRGDIQPKTYVDVRINECTSATLIGEVVNQ